MLITLSSSQSNASFAPIRPAIEKSVSFDNTFSNPIVIPPYSSIALHSSKWTRLANVNDDLLGVRLRGLSGFESYSGAISGMSHVVGYFPNFNINNISHGANPHAENASGAIYHCMNPPLYLDLHNPSEIRLNSLSVDLVNIEEQVVTTDDFHGAVVVLHVRKGIQPPRNKLK